MAFVAMDAAFPMFQIDGVRRQIPVRRRMTAVVEIQGLLADGCRWRIECRPHALLSRPCGRAREHWQHFLIVAVIPNRIAKRRRIGSVVTFTSRA
ncbi:MAG TPA: hypothetical protein VKT75_18805 [Acidobacteriaceae bacterium]|nr:hypothetical protein [Acidobacteriaceae bacterium]